MVSQVQQKAWTCLIPKGNHPIETHPVDRPKDKKCRFCRFDFVLLNFLLWLIAKEPNRQHQDGTIHTYIPNSKELFSVKTAGAPMLLFVCKHRNNQCFCAKTSSGPATPCATLSLTHGLPNLAHISSETAWPYSRTAPCATPPCAAAPAQQHPQQHPAQKRATAPLQQHPAKHTIKLQRHTATELCSSLRGHNVVSPEPLSTR